MNNNKDKSSSTEIIMRSSYPACFSSMEEYKGWKMFARIASPGNAKHCADCTPKYKLAMIKANKCENPEIRFRTVDGEIVGRLPWKE